MLDDLPEPLVERRVAVPGRSRPDHAGAAEQRRDAGHDQRVDVKQRQAGQHAFAGRQTGPLRDPAGAGKLVRVGMRGDFRRPGGPAGVHERGQIGSAGRADPGQGPGRLAVGQLVQVHGGHAGLAVQGWRDAGGAVGPQRDDRAHPGLAATSVSCCQSTGSASGPAAISTGEPVRPISPAIRSAPSAGLTGAAIPAACAARVAASSPEQFGPHSVTASVALDAQAGQAVGDPGDRAGQLGVGPGLAAGIVRRVRDPLGGDGVRPGAGGTRQQLIRRLRHGSGGRGHGVFPVTVQSWVPRSSSPSALAMLAVTRSPSRR